MSPTPATATSTEKDVFQIYDDLKKRILGISDQTQPPQGFMFSFLPAGRPVNKDDYSNPWTPDLAPETPDPAKRQRSLLNVSQLVNHKLQMNGSGQVEPGASLISDTWNVIVKAATAVPLPPIKDPKVKAALEKATRLLMKPDPDDPETVVPSDSYLNYKEYMKKYFKAIQGYTNQYVVAMLNPTTAQTWPIVGKTYLADVDSAMDDWVTIGKKDKIEDALNLLSAQGTDAATAMIATAKKLFDKYQLTLSMIPVPIQYVQLFPTNWCDADASDDGWTEYEYDSSKVRAASSSESKSWGANAGVRIGFWSFGASASHSDAHDHQEFSSEGLYIKLKYALVDIERPWLNTVLLNMNNWYLPGFKKNGISNGTVHQTKPTENEAFWLPAIPTQIIVIKDLFIKTADTHRVFDAMQSHTAAGGSFGYGPFTLGGRYEQSASSASQSVDLRNEGLQVHGLQIIGWVNQILSAAPKLDAPGVH